MLKLFMLIIITRNMKKTRFEVLGGFKKNAEAIVSFAIVKCLEFFPFNFWVYGLISLLNNN